MDAAEKVELELEEVRDAWAALSVEDRLSALHMLPRDLAEDLYLELRPAEQAELVVSMPAGERRSWLRLLALDDVADVIQEAPRELREAFLGLLDEQSRKEVSGLLTYAEDDAGGLMNPRYVRLRADMSIDEAIIYMRRQARERLELFYYAYVCDEQQRLVGVISFRQLFSAQPTQRVRDVMVTDVLAVPDEMDQEHVGQLFAQNDYLALPVVDRDGRMKGVVTADDIVQVVEEEATEDIQKIGGTAALDEPYLKIGFWRMIQKRAGWLAVLLFGEMLTATAMGHFEHEIQKAVVLALFVPLIISSGGNSGSQASTLVIRALALGEVRMRDWWRVVRRELASGLVLGTVLGLIGALRIIGWQWVAPVYGEHYVAVGATVGASLLGVILFGTVAGALLPIVLQRVGFDPASASAPLVATLVDVTGLVIYFSVAAVLLSGSLL